MILTVFEDKDKIFDALCAGVAGYLLKKRLRRKPSAPLKNCFMAVRPSAAALQEKRWNIFQNPFLQKNCNLINSPNAN
jgi:DNA-binding NarL/FixJ family response regulator